jgi:glycosyltransferase involved in cell wall biosynthesis
MSRPRICFVNPPVLLKRPISEISYNLAKKGYKTSLLIPKKLFKKRDASLHHSRLAENSNIYTYSIINPPFIKAEQPIPITPVFCINTIKALKNNDIIHMWVPYYLTSLKIIFAKKLFFPKKKLILTMDTVPGYSFSMGKFWDAMFRIYNKLFGWLLFRTPDVITLYGKSLLPYALKAGIDKEKIRVIPTGIDIKKSFVSIESKADIRKKLNLPPNTGVVLYAGLLVPRKGIGKIIKVAHKLRKEDVVFLLAGDGPNRKEYENQVKELALEKKVMFLGWRTDMHKLYQASDVLLLPAEGEGLPGVVMEAMAYGVPCVASNIPCIPDLIENNKSGFLCAKDDVAEFAKRIKELLRNKILRERMGSEALKKIKSFEWNKIMPRYEDLYSHVQK